MASAAAPTYFQPVTVDGIEAVDGGVWANDPSLAAIAEAVQHLEVPIDHIQLLSIGTTSSPTLDGKPLLLDSTIVGKFVEFTGVSKLLSWLFKLLWKPVRVQGKIGWAANIAGLLMKTQSQSVEHACRSILGDRYLRVDETTFSIKLDDTNLIPELVSLGNKTAEANYEAVAKRFLNGVPSRSWK